VSIRCALRYDGFPRGNGPSGGPLAQPITTPKPIEVLCLAGTSQNGATLLTRMLGRLPGFVAVGEIGYLRNKGLIENVE